MIMSEYDISAHNTGDLIIPYLIYDKSGKPIKKDKQEPIKIPVPVVNIDMAGFMNKTDEIKNDIISKISESFSSIPKPEAFNIDPLFSKMEEILSTAKISELNTKKDITEYKAELVQTVQGIINELQNKHSNDMNQMMAVTEKLYNALMMQVIKVEDLMRTHDYNPVIEVKAPEQRVIVEKDFTDIFRQINAIKAEINDTIKGVAKNIKQPRQWVFQVNRDSNNLMTTVTATAN